MLVLLVIHCLQWQPVTVLCVCPCRDTMQGARLAEWRWLWDQRWGTMLEDGEAEGGSLQAEVERLSLELQEANEEKLQAARYGLAVLEESASLKNKHSQLEEEHEVLKQELQQLREVRAGGFAHTHSPSTLTPAPPTPRQLHPHTVPTPPPACTPSCHSAFYAFSSDAQ